MIKYIQKIDCQITSLLSKIDTLSGNYLTNTWKRQREQQERDRKKEIYRSQLQVLEYLKQKAQTNRLSLFEQCLTVSAFYENMRCFSDSKKYCENNSYIKFQYPKSDDVRVKRLQKAGITNTEELVAAVEQFDALVQLATTPPDPNAIRLRDMLYRAQMCQKGDIQFTPPDTARELVALAGICSESRVLEPEAGIGNIADAAKEVTNNVDCIERMYEFREILKLKKHNVISDDLMEIEGYTCVAAIADEAFIYSIMRKDVPGIERLAQLGVEHYANGFGKEIKQYFIQESGFKAFAEQGTVYEVPPVYIQAADAEQRIRYFQKMLELNERGGLKIMKDTLFTFPKAFGVTVFDRYIKLYGYFEHIPELYKSYSNWIISINDNQMFEDLRSYFEYLNDMQIFYSQKGAEDFLKSMIISLGGAV